MEDERLWLDDLYPVRVRFDLTIGPVEPRIPRADVTAELGGARLRYLRRAAIIRLIDAEYHAIERLLRAASREHVGRPRSQA